MYHLGLKAGEVANRIVCLNPFVAIYGSSYRRVSGGSGIPIQGSCHRRALGQKPRTVQTYLGEGIHDDHGEIQGRPYLDRQYWHGIPQHGFLCTRSPRVFEWGHARRSVGDLVYSNERRYL